MIIFANTLLLYANGYYIPRKKVINCYQFVIYYLGLIINLITE